MVALRNILCVFTAVCCGAAFGAPTVTYDQRQHGEFNLQVDLDDVAIVLLPGSEFAQRSAIIGGKVHQIFGRRRNGAADNVSKKKKPVTCSTTTTVRTTPVVPPAPEVPAGYSELPASSTTTTQGYDDEVALLANTTQQGWNDLKPVSETFNPPDSYNPKAVVDVQADDYDPYSVTPSTPDLFTQKVVSLETEEITGAPLTAEISLKTIDNFVDNLTSTLNNSEITAEDEKANVQPTKSVVNDFEENPISVSSNVKIVEKTINDETVQTVDKSANEKATIETVDKFNKTDSEKITNLDATIKTEKKQIEKNADSKKPVESVENSMEHKAVIVKNTDVEVKMNDNGHNEMITTKTMEKPTFAEALKAVQNSENDKTETTVSSTDRVPSENPTEMIAMKIMEKPSNGEAVETSGGITTNTKVIEIQRNKNTPPRKPAVETIVSRTAPTHTEMVAVKTMENPATITTAKSVTSVKTVVKTGNAKITSSLASNGSTIMRKVGDRRPLPSITLEVAPPKVV